MEISRKNISLSNYSAGTVNNLIGGNFLTGFLLLMYADDAFIGAVTMVTYLGNILQILSPMLLERFPYRKKLLMGARACIYLLNVVVITIIPYLPTSNGLKLAVVLAVVLFVNLINAVTAPGFAVWHIKSIPQDVRAKYFSFFSVVNGIIIYTLVLISSRLVDYYRTAGNEMTGLVIIRSAALIFALLDLIFLFKIKEYPNATQTGSTGLKSVLISPFKEKRYLKTVAIACLWAFSANIPGPYFTVYMLNVMKVEYSYLNLINMVSIPISILIMPVWTRMVQKTSWFKTLCFCMSIFLLNYIGLAFVTRGTMFLYPLSVVLSFTMLTGISLTFTNIPFINIPEKNQTNFIGFYAALNNLAALLGVTLGREFITRTEEIRIVVLGTTMQNKQYILLITAVFMLIATGLIFLLQRRVEE